MPLPASHIAICIDARRSPAHRRCCHTAIAFPFESTAIRGLDTGKSLVSKSVAVPHPDPTTCRFLHRWSDQVSFISYCTHTAMMFPFGSTAILGALAVVVPVSNKGSRTPGQVGKGQHLCQEMSNPIALTR